MEKGSNYVGSVKKRNVHLAKDRQKERMLADTHSSQRCALVGIILFLNACAKREVVVSNPM